jgi:hypothetical protein
MKSISTVFKKSMLQYCSLLICILLFVFNDCNSQNNYSARHLLLRDEGMSQLSYIDLANPDKNWYEPVPPGRDMQLVGNGRVLVGTGSGFEEREIATGKKLFELTSFPGTVAARRLKNGNTLLTGVNWQGKQGIVLVEIDAAGVIKHLINFPEFDYVRLIRETASGNFLVTADNTVFEANDSGRIVWSVKISPTKAHAWQALRLANGQTLVSTGYSKSFKLFSGDGKLVDSISGPPEVKPNFYAGFQILANGNYIVTNWEGHGPKFGAIGTQLLEYTPQGKLAWSWQQDATKFSSLQGVIVLDGLDLSFLHIEDKNGMLAPVKAVSHKN